MSKVFRFTPCFVEAKCSIKNMLERLMTNEMYTPLSHLKPSMGKARALASTIASLTGLITLALENVNSFLYTRRNRAMATAMRALNYNESQLQNMASHFEDDSLMYSKYNLAASGSIGTLNRMIKKTVFIRAHNERMNMK